jgi:uncharacterized RDD family membrane protein YckC
VTAGLTAGGVAVPVDGHPAGIISRGLAGAVDLAAVFVLDVLLYASWAAVRFIAAPETFTAPDPGPVALAGSSVVLVVGYFTTGWAISGRTYGAALLGLRVIEGSGRALGWGRAALRAVCCVAFPVGILWALVSAERRSVQDLLLRTSVVYDWHRS